MIDASDEWSQSTRHSAIVGGPRFCLLVGIVLALTGVGLGAFGAHALKDHLTNRYPDVAEYNERQDNWQTSVRYQMYHAIGLMILAVACRPGWSQTASIAGGCFTGGTIVFCGCLYVLVLTDFTWLGMIVPLGGLAFLVGWGLFAVAVINTQKHV